VGRIVHALERYGLREETLILFAGDNGSPTHVTATVEGDTLQGGKGKMTDAGTHVPLIASWPGHVPSSEVSRALIDFTDFLPTFADLAGAPLPGDRTIDGVSFAVERDEFVAFVGHSGAGKSTIVSLLTRLYDPDQGEIRADSTSIQEYDLPEWRERIAVVRQQPFIFDDTLENNVTIGNRNASRADVERVCEIARVNEFLYDLPDGYESQLGDDGVRLSGGQRQRVALARALLKDADFLVLDEATSDLDSSLEKEVQAAIESMNRDYGIIAIAHRLSTVNNADRIYTINDGDIIESGTHQELLAHEGNYADLYAIQSSG
jgi:subfamily B ATP-binding cassette protein MsbA